MYNLIFDKPALKQFQKLEKDVQTRIWNKLQECKLDPFRFIEHLEKIQGFKLRVGDYRVILDVNKISMTLNILKVGHRKNVYEN